MNKIQAIKKFYKDSDYKLEFGDYPVNRRDLENFTTELENAGIINFSIYQRYSDDDFWLQIEYYSPKIRKTIIFDYDFNDIFEDIDQLAEELAKKEKEVRDFESNINLK
jgi:L-rhamnose mutarotase